MPSSVLSSTIFGSPLIPGVTFPCTTSALWTASVPAWPIWLCSFSHVPNVSQCARHFGCEVQPGRCRVPRGHIHIAVWLQPEPCHGSRNDVGWRGRINGFAKSALGRWVRALQNLSWNSETRSQECFDPWILGWSWMIMDDHGWSMNLRSD